MPSPGATAIANIIGTKTIVVEGGFTTQFQSTGEFVVKLSNAIHAGWTSASPSTPTTMTDSFASEFAGYLSGDGLLFVTCIASEIDAEIAAWVSSWVPVPGIHSFTVSATSIVSRIMACTPIVSNGSLALAEAVAEAFMSGFGQEAG